MDPREQMYDDVRRALQAQATAGEGGTPRYMPHDVIAACDLAVEDDVVQRIRQSASPPHREEWPVELGEEFAAHLLAQLDAGLQSYVEERDRKRAMQQQRLHQQSVLATFLQAPPTPPAPPAAPEVNAPAAGEATGRGRRKS